MVYRINISKDFSPCLGGRFIREGSYSGEDFYNRLLLPKFQLAVKHNTKLIINLDNTFGFPSSFLDESFGKLARVNNNALDYLILEGFEIDVRKIIQFMQNDTNV